MRLLVLIHDRCIKHMFRMNSGDQWDTNLIDEYLNWITIILLLFRRSILDFRLSHVLKINLLSSVLLGIIIKCTFNCQGPFYISRSKPPKCCWQLFDLQWQPLPLSLAIIGGNAAETFVVFLLSGRSSHDK